MTKELDQNVKNEYIQKFQTKTLSAEEQIWILLILVDYWLRVNECAACQYSIAFDLQQGQI